MTIGCDPAVEIQFLRPQVQGAAAVKVEATGASGLLQAVILDQEAMPLTAADRVATGEEVVFLDALSARQLEVAAQIVGGPLPLPVGQVTSVHYRPRPEPCVLVLVVDNSAEAAAADPTAERVVAARTMVDHALCRGQGDRPCAYAGCSVGLVALQRDEATVLVAPGADGERLDEALSELSSAAGGSAPLWDGLALAASVASEADAESGGAVVLLWGSREDGGSTASPAAVRSLLGPLPVLAVTSSSKTVGLWEVARQGEGILIEEQPGWPSELLLAAASAVGRWSVALELPPELEPELRVTGELRLTVGEHRSVSVFDLPLSVP
jgi:hypothetical protein